MVGPMSTEMLFWVYRRKVYVTLYFSDIRRDGSVVGLWKKKFFSFRVFYRKKLFIFFLASNFFIFEDLTCHPTLLRESCELGHWLRAACISSPNRWSFSCPHARHFDAVFRSLFAAAKTPEVQEKEKKEGCAFSQSQFSIPPGWPRDPDWAIMIIQLAGERPSPGQQPMTSPRWRVPQWSIPTASPPLCWHSLPSQRPIRIQGSHLVRTTLKSGSFISRPKLTPDRIWLPPAQELTPLDLASPHLLFSNPPPNPSLDCLLGV